MRVGEIWMARDGNHLKVRITKIYEESDEAETVKWVEIEPFIPATMTFDKCRSIEEMNLFF